MYTACEKMKNRLEVRATFLHSRTSLPLKEAVPWIVRCFGPGGANKNATDRKKTLTKQSTTTPSAVPPFNRRPLSVL